LFGDGEEGGGEVCIGSPPGKREKKHGLGIALLRGWEKGGEPRWPYTETGRNAIIRGKTSDRRGKRKKKERAKEKKTGEKRGDLEEKGRRSLSKKKSSDFLKKHKRKGSADKS